MTVAGVVASTGVTARMSATAIAAVTAAAAVAGVASARMTALGVALAGAGAPMAGGMSRAPPRLGTSMCGAACGVRRARPGLFDVHDRLNDLLLGLRDEAHLVGGRMNHERIGEDCLHARQRRTGLTRSQCQRDVGSWRRAVGVDAQRATGHECGRCDGESEAGARWLLSRARWLLAMTAGHQAAPNLASF